MRDLYGVVASQNADKGWYDHPEEIAGELAAQDAAAATFENRAPQVAVALLLDEHLPTALAPALRTAGLDAVHLIEAGWRGLDDEPLLEATTAQGRVLVTARVVDELTNQLHTLRVETLADRDEVAFVNPDWQRCEFHRRQYTLLNPGNLGTNARGWAMYQPARGPKELPLRDSRDAASESRRGPSG